MSNSATSRLGRSLRPCACLFTLVAVVLVLLGRTGTVRALTSEPVIRVEEDWMVVLNEPDGNLNAPQFHTVMSPFDDFRGAYAQVLWNYRETPTVASGGVQLQGYYGPAKTNQRSLKFRKLDSAAETISWTQGLATDGVLLSFEIINGSSTTWGAFAEGLRLDEEAHLPDLSEYRTEFSRKHSGVTFGSNRVNLMMITKVRRFGPSGLLSEDDSPRVVFQSP